MPPFFDEWLRSLPDAQADDLWLWLDATSDAVHDTIDALIDSHPAVVAADAAASAAHALAGAHAQKAEVQS